MSDSWMGPWSTRSVMPAWNSAKALTASRGLGSRRTCTTWTNVT